jgi:hypothetical protein
LGAKLENQAKLRSVSGVLVTAGKSLVGRFSVLIAKTEDVRMPDADSGADHSLNLTNGLTPVIASLHVWHLLNVGVSFAPGDLFLLCNGRSEIMKRRALPPSLFCAFWRE